MPLGRREGRGVRRSGDLEDQYRPDNLLLSRCAASDVPAGALCSRSCIRPVRVSFLVKTHLGIRR